MVFYIQLCGIVIRINALYKKTAHLFGNYIIENFDGNPDFTVEIDYEDVSNEFMITKMGSMLTSGSKEYYFFNREHHEFLAIHRKIANRMPFFNRFLMHGSVFSVADQAYMFSAPSGVGKTTRTRLWVEEYPETIVVNGDKPFLSVEDNAVIAYGTPWCGKEGWNTNTFKSLHAILFIERAERKSCIKQLNFSEAMPFLLQQTYMPKDEHVMRITLKLLKDMAGKVKFYRFQSEPTHEAIRMAHDKVMEDE